MSNMERGKNDPREEGGYALDPFLRAICLFCRVVRFGERWLYEIDYYIPLIYSISGA